MLALACIVLAAGCSKRNEALCCESTAECTTIGFSSVQPCDLGVCVNYACTSVPGACDDDHDCDGTSNAAGTTTAACVANTCAVCAISASCPASAPICDETSHDCRTCAKDAECASGACNLAVGTCVDTANILYASPKGTEVDPCTQVSPCSLGHATDRADIEHTYVVMSPGEHSGNGVVAKNTITIVGNNSTYIIRQTGAEIYPQYNATVTIRDLTIVDQIEMRSDNEPSAIDCEGCLPQGLTLDNVTVNTNIITPLTADEVTIRNSRFNQRVSSKHLNADSTTFMSGVYTESPSRINNSVIINGLSIGGYDSAHNYGEAILANNTLIGGVINCGTPNTTLVIRNSIIISPSSFTISSCNNVHHKNLTYPDPYLGTDELVTDPLFVDVTHQDYHLKPSSPAIDAADPVTATVRDLDGVGRPQGAGPDMGAFEYVPVN